MNKKIMGCSISNINKKDSLLVFRGKNELFKDENELFKDENGYLVALFLLFRLKKLLSID